MDFIDAYRIGFTSQKNYGIDIDLLAIIIDRYGEEILCKVLCCRVVYMCDFLYFFLTVIVPTLFGIITTSQNPTAKSNKE